MSVELTPVQPPPCVCGELAESGRQNGALFAIATVRSSSAHA